MRVAFHNLGCKVNYYESEAMKQMLSKAGYTIVGESEEADICIINTCSVTNIADRKSRQMLHKYKRLHPSAIVIAAGCYVQAAGEELLKDESVDIIVGNDRKKQIVEIIEEYQKSNADNVYLYDLTKSREYEELTLDTENDRTRAYIKIQDGCNQFCSYCIIPYTRGRIRSRNKEDILSEAKRLGKSGIKEIVLTGIHVSSYGMEKKEEAGDYLLGGSKSYLADIIEAVAEIPEIKRIRLSSLEPRIIAEEFAERLSKIEKLCPHFHLSLQSGCDSVLKRMNRHYTTAEYEEGASILRKYFDDPALTTDVIVGFPGETAEEFEETVHYLEKIKLFRMHIFKFSRRKGTVADRMSGQLTESIKEERSNVLLALNEKLEAEYRKASAGRMAEVLFETKEKIGEKEYYVGYTKEYIRAAVPAEDEAGLCGNIVKVRLIEDLEGEIMLATEC